MLHHHLKRSLSGIPLEEEFSLVGGFEESSSEQWSSNQAVVEQPLLVDDHLYRKCSQFFTSAFVDRFPRCVAYVTPQSFFDPLLDVTDEEFIEPVEFGVKFDCQTVHNTRASGGRYGRMSGGVHSKTN